MEKEMAEKEYYNKVKGSTKDVSKTLDARADYGSPSDRGGKYKEKLGRMIATSNTPMMSGKKQVGMPKVTFYQRNNRSMLAERGLVSMSKTEIPKSEDNRS